MKKRPRDSIATGYYNKEENASETGKGSRDKKITLKNASIPLFASFEYRVISGMSALHAFEDFLNI